MVEAAAEVQAAAVVEERSAAAAAAEAGVEKPQAVATAAEVEVAVAAAPIPVLRVSCVYHHKPFVCERLAAQHHVSHWRQYSFAETL